MKAGKMMSKESPVQNGREFLETEISESLWRRPLSKNKLLFENRSSVTNLIVVIVKQQ